MFSSPEKYLVPQHLCDHEIYESSVNFVFQWDLVCSRFYLAELSQTLFSVGGLFGELIAALLMDRYGRKWVAVAGYVGVVALGSGLAFTRSYLAFAITRTLLAVCVAVSAGSWNFQCQYPKT